LVRKFRKLTCSARHSVICFDRALIRLAARRKRTNGFAVKLEERPPKPAFVLPEHFESQVPHIMIARTAPRHSAIPLVDSSYAALLLERCRELNLR